MKIILIFFIFFTIPSLRADQKSLIEVIKIEFDAAHPEGILFAKKLGRHPSFYIAPFSRDVIFAQKGLTEKDYLHLTDTLFKIFDAAKQDRRYAPNCQFELILSEKTYQATAIKKQNICIDTMDTTYQKSLFKWYAIARRFASNK